jgi:hypothetical protein
MAYVFTFWTCYVLLREYEIVATMRLRFLASEKRRPDQFTVCSSYSLYSVIMFLISTSGSSYFVYYVQVINIVLEIYTASRLPLQSNMKESTYYDGLFHNKFSDFI